MLALSLNRALTGHDFRLIAFVFMPDHVHLLTYPVIQTPRLDLFLKAVKRPFAYRVKQDLLETRNPLLEQLIVRERPGVECFRFWQEGGGYDRNLQSEAAIVASIDYIHQNPVRRGLCEKVIDWKWSSASYFLGLGSPSDADFPEVAGLPPDFMYSP